ncbi:MAG: hypothetical protein K9M99_10730 [Candidatus Cloacimonetes bacterium]|nr:hypothetical protein [Candidatus Cloacimonadota bacterium]
MPDIKILNDIIQEIYAEQQVRCYFCQIIGKRWSFLTGDNDILAAPVKYIITPFLGLIADKEITDLARYFDQLR